MSKIVFLLEEPSMETLLRGILPRLLPGSEEGSHWILVPHSGKRDLELSIPRKLKAWRDPGVKFLIIRDQDSGDCRKVKAQLVKLAESGGRRDAVVRIACRELEAWYFGDLPALAAAYECADLAEMGRKAAFRNPDTIPSPARELEQRIPEFGKMEAARRMGATMDLGNGNFSRSWHHVLESIRKLSPN